MKIQLTVEAKNDLESLPLPVKERILKKISYLSDFPLMGVKMEDAFQGFRCLLADDGNYRIIYKVLKKSVVVYYLRHAARQLGLRLAREK